MPRVETETDVRDIENSLDLPRRLHVGAGLVVERRLVTAGATPRDDFGQSHLHAVPAVVVEAPRMIDVTTTRIVSSALAPRVGDRRMRHRSGNDGPHGVEGIEHRVEFGIERRQGVVVGEGEFQIGPSQTELTTGEALRQYRTIAEVTHGPE